MTQNEAMREIARLCHRLDDRALITAIYSAVEGREMFRDDLLILRMRLDFLYKRRFDKSVQDHTDPVQSDR